MKDKITKIKKVSGKVRILLTFKAVNYFDSCQALKTIVFINHISIIFGCFPNQFTLILTLLLYGRASDGNAQFPLVFLKLNIIDFSNLVVLFQKHLDINKTFDLFIFALFERPSIVFIRAFQNCAQKILIQLGSSLE